MTYEFYKTYTVLQKRKESVYCICRKHVSEDEEEVKKFMIVDHVRGKTEKIGKKKQDDERNDEEFFDGPGRESQPQRDK